MPPFHPFGIVLILGPAGGVIADVLADAVQAGFIADDVFVIIALP